MVTSGAALLPRTVLPELDEIERIVAQAGPLVQCHVACRVTHRGTTLPLYAITMGNPDPRCPGIAFVGGIHGIELIGARVVIAFLRSLVARLPWDPSLQTLLQQTRILFLPLVNPVGALARTRANGAGVDLMRNAPVECDAAAPLLLAGHRIGGWLPWYRGRSGGAMEPESAAVVESVTRELHGRPLALVLDCHSGFGLRDRVWFPFAHRRSPIESLAELHALHEIFVRAHPHHAYVFEPQSNQYLTHGDLWDHLVLQAPAGSVFLPLTLEMGSWLWVKKNPRQLFTRQGVFNPLIEHRERRVLRRHLPLLDFLLRAAAGHEHWLPDPACRAIHRERALVLWYGARRP